MGGCDDDPDCRTALVQSFSLMRALENNRALRQTMVITDSCRPSESFFIKGYCDLDFCPQSHHPGRTSHSNVFNQGFTHGTLARGGTVLTLKQPRQS
jgi:hypothetical protein